MSDTARNVPLHHSCDQVSSLHRGTDACPHVAPSDAGSLAGLSGQLRLLVTAADGAAWAYKKWPEAHRLEEPADAIRIDRPLQQAWGGHPNYLHVDNDGRDWQAKSREAREILARLL